MPNKYIKKKSEEKIDQIRYGEKEGIKGTIGEKRKVRRKRKRKRTKEKEPR